MIISINSNNEDPSSDKRLLNIKTRKINISSNKFKKNVGFLTTLLFLLSFLFVSGISPVLASEENNILKIDKISNSINLKEISKITATKSEQMVLSELKNKEKSIILSEVDTNISENGIIKEIIEKQEEEKEQKKREIQEEAVAKDLKELLKGHPMENMADLIAKEDGEVIAFIIAIGKKESNWGKRSPSKNGQDCYNYWGFKTSGSRGQALGHACFGSQKEAVDKIAKRIEKLVKVNKRNTPEKMVVWKCGSDCSATGGQAAANKWISDIRLYRDKVFALEHFKEYKLEKKENTVKLAKVDENQSKVNEKLENKIIKKEVDTSIKYNKKLTYLEITQDLDNSLFFKEKNQKLILSV